MEPGRSLITFSYRGHNAPKDKQFMVNVAGQKRGLSPAIKRAFRRRSAVEPVIGHLKNEHRMTRNHLAAAATPPTPCSPPLATTSGSWSYGSAFCAPGWPGYCATSCPR